MTMSEILECNKSWVKSTSDPKESVDHRSSSEARLKHHAHQPRGAKLEKTREMQKMSYLEKNKKSYL